MSLWLNCYAKWRFPSPSSEVSSSYKVPEMKISKQLRTAATLKIKKEERNFLMEVVINQLIRRNTVVHIISWQMITSLGKRLPKNWRQQRQRGGRRRRRQTWEKHRSDVGTAVNSVVPNWCIYGECWLCDYVMSSIVLRLLHHLHKDHSLGEQNARWHCAFSRIKILFFFLLCFAFLFPQTITALP